MKTFLQISSNDQSLRAKFSAKNYQLEKVSTAVIEVNAHLKDISTLQFSLSDQISEMLGSANYVSKLGKITALREQNKVLTRIREFWLDKLGATA